MSGTVMRLRLGFGFFGFTIGGLFGGCAHLMLLANLAWVMREHAGLDPRYWGLRSVGDAFGTYIFLYLLPCGSLLALAISAYGLRRLSEAIIRRLDDTPRQPYRFPAIAWLTLIVGALLGAVCAAAANLRLMNAEYGTALAAGERYAVATAAVIPQLREATIVYDGFLLLLCGGVVLVYRMQSIHRNT